MDIIEARSPHILTSFLEIMAIMNGLAFARGESQTSRTLRHIIESGQSASISRKVIRDEKIRTVIVPNYMLLGICCIVHLAESLRKKFDRTLLSPTIQAKLEGISMRATIASQTIHRRS